MIRSSERCSYILGLSLFATDSCFADLLDDQLCSEAQTGYLTRIASVDFKT